MPLFCVNMENEDTNEIDGNIRVSDCGTEDESTQLEKNNIKMKKVVKPIKKLKRGIIYLSMIPPFMTVAAVREIFSIYGKVGRIYLQLDETEMQAAKHKKKKKVIKSFTEGWVEFESKKTAKFVTKTLHNAQISTRKRSRYYDYRWYIKYLPRFKWVHLNERLAYERAVHKQRLLTEIAQAKREVNFFSRNVDKSRKLHRKSEKGEVTTFNLPEIKQRDTDNEIRNRKAEPETDTKDRTEFLKLIFE